MADLRERILAEAENVQRALDQIPSVEKLALLSELELAGTAALLHNIYGGIENMLKQMLLDHGDKLPEGASWHRELLSLAGQRGIVHSSTVEALRPFMAFRHFFSHAYALDLEPDRMETLVSKVGQVVSLVQKDLAEHLGRR